MSEDQRVEPALPETPLGVLVFSNPSGREPIVLAGRQRTTIGRRAPCDVVIDDRRISRFHAVIDTIGGLPVLRDAGSSNGTFLNGLRVSADHGFVLREGDVIELGGHRVVYGTPAESQDLPALGSVVAYPIADLVRDGHAKLGDDERMELQVSLQRAFEGTTRGIGVERCLELALAKLGAHSAVILVESAAKLRPIAAKPSFAAVGQLVAVAEKAAAQRAGVIEIALPDVELGALGETSVFCGPSVAAVPFEKGTELSGTIAIERIAGHPIDRAELAKLAVLGERFALTLSLQGASANDTQPGYVR